jgi:acetyl-CoA carboxylase biotin carboxyl carrier protein
MPSPKTPAASAADSQSVEAAGSIDTRLVRRLAGILKDTGLTEIEVQQGELRIRVARTAATMSHAAPAVAYAAPTHPTPAHEAPAATAAPAAPAAPVHAGEVIKSPMVGTVYLQPQPESPKFIKIGDSVTEGQTLLIIEAMKTMNPIPAPKAGKVLQILIGDGQAVEFGEPLVVIE